MPAFPYLAQDGGRRNGAPDLQSLQRKGLR